jgi:hypothetical protein
MNTRKSAKKEIKNNFSYEICNYKTQRKDNQASGLPQKEERIVLPQFISKFGQSLFRK